MRAEAAESPAGRALGRLLNTARRAQPLLRALASIALAFVLTAMLIMIAGKNPFTAYYHLVTGAFGSWDRIIVGLNKTTPYLLCAIGIALCFRGNVINIGAEGQIAIGGLAASAVALAAGGWPAWTVLPLAIAAGALSGASWGGGAAAGRATRGGDARLGTLPMKFISLLVGGQERHRQMGGNLRGLL